MLNCLGSHVVESRAYNLVFFHQLLAILKMRINHFSCHLFVNYSQIPIHFGVFLNGFVHMANCDRIYFP